MYATEVPAALKPTSPCLSDDCVPLRCCRHRLRWQGSPTHPQTWSSSPQSQPRRRRCRAATRCPPAASAATGAGICACMCSIQILRQNCLHRVGISSGAGWRAEGSMYCSEQGGQRKGCCFYLQLLLHCSSSAIPPDLLLTGPTPETNSLQRKCRTWHVHAAVCADGAASVVCQPSKP